nr:hypothetical protein [Mammaliicoccus sp. Marseille-Q6498]
MNKNVKKGLDYLVKSGKLESTLHKANDKYKEKSGKDYSKYINKVMDKVGKKKKTKHE